MIKVEEFSNADELQHFINTHNIKKEDIIDIKWCASLNNTYGLLLYEAPIEPSIHEVNSITSSDFTYRRFGL